MFFEWLQQLMGGSQASPMPHPDDFTSTDKYTFAEKRWKLQEEERRKRQQMYQEMAQTPGDTPAAYKSRMGTREARPFFADTRPIVEGSVDILAPEVETLADLYRKRENMFRMV